MGLTDFGRKLGFLLRFEREAREWGAGVLIGQGGSEKIRVLGLYSGGERGCHAYKFFQNFSVGTCSGV